MAAALRVRNTAYVQNERRLPGFDSAFDEHGLPDQRLQPGLFTRNKLDAFARKTAHSLRPRRAPAGRGTLRVSL